MSSLPPSSSSSPARPGLPSHAELHCVSGFSFQRGASTPQELIARAHRLGYSALAITDDCSVAGVVRAYAQWKALKEEAEQTHRDFDFKLIVGSEFTVQTSAEPFKLVALARNREGYGHLSEFITSLRRDSPKGTYCLHQDQITAQSLDHCTVLLVPPRPCSLEAMTRLATWARATFADRAWLAAELLAAWDDPLWLDLLQQASQATGVPLVATSDVHFHVRSRKPLHDVMTATRLGRPVSACGMALQPNAERHLRSRLRLARRYPAHLLQATQVIAAECNFDLKTLGYEYPPEIVPEGQTPASHLRQLTETGIARRYPFPNAPPAGLHEQIEKELALIRELDYERFFLTVEDVVRYARSQNILCQGRGSAANSAVCYCLGITEVDPARSNLLFERFLSRERDEPPDIDVDFEHQRRPEVIAYLYGKYGRHRTALAATVISYRTRSAVRDVGKALGFEADLVDALAKSHQWWETSDSLHARLRELGLDPDAPAVRQWTTLTEQLIGMPRHLSQHVGGFVIAAESLGRMVPIENTAMPDRSVIQWDKDDLETLGLLKVDVLALGMLSAIRRSLDFLGGFNGRKMSMQDIPSEDPATYDMICAADTVGVFQIESRAQMSMLPRLRPRRYYDLVVQVAIVRPGPIQGGMVHPFLKSREDKRNAKYPELYKADYPDILEKALHRTNGVPIFQEQVMQIVMLGAGFTPGEADQLRRAMAAWKRKGGLEPFKERIIHGLTDSTKDEAFALRIFEMIKGFGEYGFPESHAAGFALLAYVSSWLKCHEPGAFLAGLLNAQPMGFYAPSQLVQDARRHGVTVLPADVSHSEVESSMDDRLTVRLGLRLINGLGEPARKRIAEARSQHPFTDVNDLARRAQLDQSDLRHLASADALQSLAGHRRQQVWEASALHRAPGLLREVPVHEAPLLLPAAPEGEEVVFDYAATGLTLRRHPLALLRPALSAKRLEAASQLLDTGPQGRNRNGRLVRTCGLVTMRQQPPTAKGTIFVSLEDETGSINVVVWSSVRDRYRAPLLQARLLMVCGTWQSIDGVNNLIAQYLADLTPMLGELHTTSRDFH